MNEAYTIICAKHAWRPPTVRNMLLARSSPWPNPDMPDERPLTLANAKRLALYTVILPLLTTLCLYRRHGILTRVWLFLLVSSRPTSAHNSESGCRCCLGHPHFKLLLAVSTMGGLVVPRHALGFNCVPVHVIRPHLHAPSPLPDRKFSLAYLFHAHISLQALFVL